MTTPSDQQQLEEVLRRLPRDELLAFAHSILALVNAQISSGKKITPEELATFNRVYELLRSNGSPAAEESGAGEP